MINHLHFLHRWDKVTLWPRPKAFLLLHLDLVIIHSPVVLGIDILNNSVAVSCVSERVWHMTQAGSLWGPSLSSAILQRCPFYAFRASCIEGSFKGCLESAIPYITERWERRVCPLDLCTKCVNGSGCVGWGLKWAEEKKRAGGREKERGIERPGERGSDR